MPRTCSVCTHPQRGEIEKILLAETALRDIARQWRVSKDALFRHRSEHIPAYLTKAKEAEETSQASKLLARLCELSRETAAILKEARTAETKDNELALKAIARAEKQIELQAKLLGELQEGQTVNILVNPEWQQIRTVIIEALAPYPAARLAVAEALGRVNGHASA